MLGVFGWVVTPVWLAVGSQWFDTADASSALGFTDMVKRLVLSALIPATIGQLLRSSKRIESFVDRNKPWFSNAAQIIILTLVFISAFRGGLSFDNDNMSDNLRHTEFAIVWACCIALHLVAMLLSWAAGGFLRFNDGDRRASVFAGSQKTLPIGILVSQATGYPFSILPMLMFHASQLFIDTWIADELKRRTDRG